MIEHFLTLDLISTVGATEEWAELDGGVPQGYPLSPILFNLYIDELANQLARVGR